ncbi:hypothetical protein ACHAW5_005001 [Stephanodiscus triporus]|uniref:LNS2/PITP domain-containing protein n=1 Tax=Stephanodiscus triporus TaxID=2934178 RepID=A0ABD3MBS4_9STRA
MAWAHPPTAATATPKSASARSVLPSRRSSAPRMGCGAEEGATTGNSEEEEEEAGGGIEVGVRGWETLSERGTSCTEPVHDNCGATSTRAPSLCRGASTTRIDRRRAGNVQLRVNGRYVPQLDMTFSSNRRTGASGGLNLFGVGGDGGEPSCRFVDGNGLRPPTGALDALLHGDDGPAGGGAILGVGRNLLRYTLLSGTGEVVATAEAHLYLWRSCDSVVVSDVDGTVTRSDLRGVIDTLLQDKFQHVHDGICKFYHALMDAGNDRGNDIHRGGGGDGSDSPGVRGRAGEVRFLYLSSRPIVFVNQTRKLLVSLSQTCPSRTQKNYGLPPGPVMCHTGPLSSVLYSELVTKDIYQFKADVLARQVVLPFVAARGEVECKQSSSPRRRTVSFDGLSVNINGDAKDEVDDPAPEQNLRSSSVSDFSSSLDDRLFLAGFGNKITDAIAYEMAGIDRGDIYIIDKESRIVCMGGNERNDDSSRSIMSDLNGVLAQSECFLAREECCDGGADRQLQSKLSAPNANKAAMSIHSIELSLTECRGLEFLESPELFTTATTVDVYVTREKETGIKSATSKWTKIKQSIRPFSSKRNSFMRFPSLGSVSSSGVKSSSKKLIYRGYDDPLLFARICERMVV